MIIIDTSILIDYSRSYKPAQEFLNNTYQKQLYAVSVITAIELIKGAKNKKAQIVSEDLLTQFDILYLNEKITSISFELIKNYHLNQSLDLADALIAATALQHKAQLLTRNLKDFDFIPKLNVQSPY